MLAIVMIGGLLILLIDGVTLARQQRWRELGAVGVLLGVAGFIAVAGRLGLPTPIEGMQRMLGPAGEALFRFK